MKNSKLAIEIIDYLVSVGNTKDSFSGAFPYIHHFHNSGSGDASLEGFYLHCNNHELEVETNMNVLRRLEIIKEKIYSHLEVNPGQKISSIKFQRFAKEAVNEIPFK